ncbi:MAG: helix-turn-helix domain-containing protein [Candidatus Omnitrophica bacterium]|nr:helix-turn-helix domain-containing protein [Candidatus Omnitrophota bacterium]
MKICYSFKQKERRIVAVAQKEKTPSRSQIMTTKEAAKYLGIHLITLYRLIKKGEIPSFRIGGLWRLKKDLLDEWILNRLKGKGK